MPNRERDSDSMSWKRLPDGEFEPYHKDCDLKRMVGGIVSQYPNCRFSWESIYTEYFNNCKTLEFGDDKYLYVWPHGYYGGSYAGLNGGWDIPQVRVLARCPIRYS